MGLVWVHLISEYLVTCHATWEFSYLIYEQYFAADSLIEVVYLSYALRLYSNVRVEYSILKTVGR